VPHLISRKYYMLALFVCGLGAAFYSYEYFLRILPSVMEGQLRAHFGLTATGFGFLSAFYYYAYVPMQVPVGVMMDSFGPRRLLTVACLICVLGSLLFSLTLHFQLAALGRFLVGFGSAFGFVGVLKLAAIWLPENKMALAAGTASALGTISASVGDNMLGSMVQKFGWEATVNWVAYFGIVLAIVLWFGIKEKRSHNPLHESHVSTRKILTDMMTILKNGQVWINGMYGCLVYLPTTVFAELWGIPYLTHAHGLTHAGAEFCNSMLFLGFTIGAPINGYISDKIARRKLPMFFGAMGAAIVMSVIIYMPHLTQSTLNILMFGLGLLYSSQAIVFAVGRELSPEEAAGTAIATTNMMVMMGAMLLQPLVGKLLDLSQLWNLTHSAEPTLILTAPNVQEMVHSAADYQLALSILPIGILMAAILTFFLRETYASTNYQPKHG
jgi:sugar phosphate permease